MYKRALYHQILPYLEHKNALVITGMRQVGKTTLMRQLAEAWKQKYIWFDFDNPLDLMTFESRDYRGIFEQLRIAANASQEERFLVCIDEIQNFPEITTIIKFLIDHYNVKFIVTGSSNYYLRNLFPESLSGRKFLFLLQPLSFREFLHFHGKLKENQLVQSPDEMFCSHNGITAYQNKEYFEEYMQFGGFPEVVKTRDNATKWLILKNIFASFFEKDIKVFTELRDIRELRDLLLVLGPRNGNMIDISRLASELGISRPKVYNYLEFLEGIFFLRLIPKFSKSIDRSVAGGKKVYFADTGILNLICKVSAGQLLEVVIANLLNQYGELSFYNKRNTAEIDFILNREIAIEVKQKPILPDLKKLEYLAKELNIKQYFIVSNTLSELENILYPWMF